MGRWALGKTGAYGGSFAMTDSDWERPLVLFTGEKITTRAGRSHILARKKDHVSQRRAQILEKLLFPPKVTA